MVLQLWSWWCNSGPTPCPRQSQLFQQIQEYLLPQLIFLLAPAQPPASTTQESQHPSYCLYCCQTANLIATAVLADIAILADKAISTKKDYDCYPHHQHAIPILLYPSSSCQYQTLDLRFHITPQYSPYSLISHFHLSSFIYSSPSWRMGAEKFLILMRMGAGEAPWWSLRMPTEHSFPLLPYSSCHGYGYSLLKP